MSFWIIQELIRGLLLTVIGILPVTETDIDHAINRHWRDFEDAVQYSVAESNGVDYIISRDVNGFEETSIPCYSPTGFLRMIQTGEIIIGEQ